MRYEVLICNICGCEDNPQRIKEGLSEDNMISSYVFNKRKNRLTPDTRFELCYDCKIRLRKLLVNEISDREIAYQKKLKDSYDKFKTNKEFEE